MTKDQSPAPLTTEGGDQPANCPFCGGKAYATRTVNGTQMFNVGCASCGVEMKAAWYRGEDKPTKDILALWNTRAALVAAQQEDGDLRCTICDHEIQLLACEECWKARLVAAQKEKNEEPICRCGSILVCPDIGCDRYGLAAQTPKETT